MNGQLRSIRLAVEATALELVHRNSLDEVENILVQQGLLTTLVSKLVLLIPSAFAAAHYEPTGIEFPTQFLVGPPGEEETRPYAAEPGYVEAKLLAERWLTEGRPSLIARVLDWSAEANCIKEANSKGLHPTKISMVHHGESWE
jgi:hypothetical protein